MGLRTRLRGRRRWAPSGAAAIAVSAVLAAGCGSSSAGTTAAPSPAATITVDAGVAYVQGLDDATQAMSGIADLRQSRGFVSGPGHLLPEPDNRLGASAENRPEFAGQHLGRVQRLRIR